MDEIIIGIDLGTTYSSVAYVDDDGRPHLVPNAENKNMTPSVVLIEDGNIVVGEAAAKQAKLKPDNVIQWIKRSIGDQDYEFHGLSPIEISAKILSKLKNDAETNLSQVLDKGVITCPAYFAGPQVENTKKAGEMAGLDVIEIVREPTAAAVYYGVEHLKEGEKVLVYDLGGGTFDATILELRKGKFSPLATLGDRQLGGHDFTTDILEYVSRQFSDTFGEDPRNVPLVHQELYERCEMAKRDLAYMDKVVIPCVFGDKPSQVEVTYETFKKLIEHHIKTTILNCERVLTKAEPPLKWSDINKILLVGGSTRVRRVPEALEEVSGITPIQTGEVDTMVALGAAIIAKGMVRPRRAYISPDSTKASRSGLIMPVDIDRPLPRNLGTRVIVWEGETPKIVNSVILPYGALVPTEKTRDDYSTAVHNQQYFDIPIIEFDDIGVDEELGTYRFQCPPSCPAGSGIGVTFKYDISQIPEVEARDLRTGGVLPKEKVKYEEPDLSSLKSSQKPRQVVFALDVSGSMAGDPLTKAKQALLETATGLLKKLGGQTSVGVVTFGSQASPLCDLTTDLAMISQAISGISVSGSTRMDKGIDTAAEMLRDQVREYACEIALVTDGMPDSEEATLQAATVARGAGVQISAVGIGSEYVGENFLHKVASGVLMIESADQLMEALPNLLMQSRQDQETAITWGS